MNPIAATLRAQPTATVSPPPAETGVPESAGGGFAALLGQARATPAALPPAPVEDDADHTSDADAADEPAPRETPSQSAKAARRLMPPRTQAAPPTPPADPAAPAVELTTPQSNLAKDGLAGDSLADAATPRKNLRAGAADDTAPFGALPTLPAPAAVRAQAVLAARTSGEAPGASEVPPPLHTRPGAAPGASDDTLSSGLAAPAMHADGTASTPVSWAATPAFTLPSAVARSDAQVLQTQVAVPPDAPGFAPALATQVRWLVEGQVQHAQIQLNPAEMGPVAVRIQLEGTQARVDFAADVAATRSAIEASLPTLAAALADGGLTLAGGGVFGGTGQQAGRQDGDTARQALPLPGRSGGAAAAADSPAPAMALPVRARGLVDLVA